MKGVVEAVYCEIQYSGVGAGLLIAAAAATLGIAAATPLDAPLHLALGAWVVAMACHAWRSLHAIRGVRLDGTRAIEVTGADGACRRGTLREGSFVAPWLTIVRWRPAESWRDRTVVILPGMTGTDEFRRLRVLMIWA